MNPLETTDACTSSISRKLARLAQSQSVSCIFKVHSQLREVNEKAYEPEIVAIGPYHRHKHGLEMMEEHKLRYLQQLLQRNNDCLGTYVVAMRHLEDRAHGCFTEPTGLPTDEFIEMMVLDGVFIVELLRKFFVASLRSENDPIFKMSWMITSLQRDLMLFENQLPFFVLCELFDMIEAPNQDRRFIFLVLNFFRDLFPGPGYRDNANGDSRDAFKHLLDLIYRNWLPLFVIKANDGAEKQPENWMFIQCASELREAGVRFEKKTEEGSLFDIEFRNGTLLIPALTIEDRTETFLRNLIVHEQYLGDSGLHFVTDYAKFLDCIVDSTKDVEILCRHGIIDNWLGGNEGVSLVVNKMTNAVAGPGKCFHYAGVFNRVNAYCNTRRNHWMAKLRRNYFNSPWGILSIVAAILLLLLTLIQTLFTILSYDPSTNR